MQRMMFGIVGLACLLGAVAEGEIRGEATSSITVDGNLDEAVWKTATWKDGIAVVTSPDTVYVGVRGEKAEVSFAPSGSKFDFYRFAFGPTAADCTAAFYSEGGNIQPDPYAPFWPHKSAEGKDGWTHEAAIPLSAFYLTRNRDWKTTWLVRRGASGTFAEETDFPKRSTGDDVFIRSVEAKIAGFDGASLEGELKLNVEVAQGGLFRVKTSVGKVETEVTLREGANRVRVPCRYAQRGRKLTHVVLTRVADGRKCGRSYPVLVDYQPIAVKLTVPQYRNSFYPGQDVSRVAGTVSIAGGVAATVTLEGPGFAKRTVTVKGGKGEFAFDTKGFAIGDAELTVTSGTDEKKVKIRNLPPTKTQMVWIEKGRLVVNGRQVLRRNVYADNWQCGQAFSERYARENADFCKTPEFEKFIHISPDWIIPDKASECYKDVKPCDEYFRKLDAILEKNRSVDFGFYYINDEPECRGVSQVYLKYIYDYVAEKDPYHPMLTASRGGKTYIDCFDWAETHPYLSPRNHPDGTRTYGRHPNEMGSYLDAFEAADRPDKVIGFLPTCFAYRYQSLREDYPTFDEYVLHTWAAMMRGGKSLWPYAGHDIGDRPSIYEGTKYIFSSFAALDDIVLNGARTTFAKSKDIEGVLYELPDEKMFVVVNFTGRPQQVTLPKTAGAFREFRGKRTFNLSASATNLRLEPLETVVACTKEHDRGLVSFADARAKALADEKARLARDNQLLGREADIVFSSNMKVRGYYKLVDGTPDMLSAYSDYKTNVFLEAAFTHFTPRFSTVRVWGRGDLMKKTRLVVRQRGEWRRVEPKHMRIEKEYVELDVGEPISTVKLRLEFPGEYNRHNTLELYEIELPRCAGAAADGAAKKLPPLKDAGVKWMRTGKDVSTFKMDKDKSGKIVANASGGFTANCYFCRYEKTDPAHRWIVIDLASFQDSPEPGYRAWNAHWNDQAGKLRYIAGTVSNPQAGIYTFELPADAAFGDSCLFKTYVYGLSLDFNSIALMEKPANRVEVDCTDGVAKVRVFLAEPCEDIAAEFLMAPGTGGLNPFAVNGTHGLELKPFDAEQCVWGADVKIVTCAEPKASIYVKASILGGALDRPLFGRFKQFSAR